MDAIRKLLSDIKAKDNENFKYGLEKNKLEEDVKESEERIGKKIKILEKLFTTEMQITGIFKETDWKFKQNKRSFKWEGKYFRYGMYYKSILLDWNS